MRRSDDRAGFERLPFGRGWAQNEIVNERDREVFPLSATEAIQAAKRASERSAAVVHEEMKEGLNGLATIASIAPLVGLFGTVMGIPTSFVGCNGEKSACMAAVAERLSGSIWPTAMGLLVGLTSLWCYRYLADRLEDFDLEMENASLDLVNRLIVYGRRLNPGPAIKGVGDIS
jgi:biopolymer transport protein ExbB/TolQ